MLNKPPKVGGIPSSHGLFLLEVSVLPQHSCPTPHRLYSLYWVWLLPLRGDRDKGEKEGRVDGWEWNKENISHLVGTEEHCVKHQIRSSEKLWLVSDHQLPEITGLFPGLISEGPHGRTQDVSQFRRSEALIHSGGFPVSLGPLVKKPMV